VAGLVDRKDDVADLADVVGDNDGAEDLNDWDNYGFLHQDGDKIAIANCDHGGAGPIISPYVELEPIGAWRKSVLGLIPIPFTIYFKQSEEDGGNEVGEEYIKGEYLEQFPIPFLLESIDEH
jgi:hypothetical protein